MTIALIVLIIEYAAMLVANVKIRRTVFDAFFFVMTPYVAIIFINNILMVSLKFKAISDSVIWLHCIALLVFYIGSGLGEFLAEKVKIKIKPEGKTLAGVNPKVLICIAAVCIAAVAADFIRLMIQYGFSQFFAMGEDAPRGFIASHLLILLIPVMILLLDYFFETWKAVYIILVCVIFGLLFLTFVKYHVISAVLAAFIYIAIARPKYLKRIGAIVLALVVVVFVSNYFIGFAAAGKSASGNFYINHLWKYIGGGTINVERVVAFAKGKSDLSIFAWVAGMLLGFPAMLYTAVTGNPTALYHFSTRLPLFRVAAKRLSERSNVVSLLGAAYAQSGIVLFCVFTLVLGFILQWVFIRAKRGNSIRYRVVASVFLGFNMLSFFSCFFELSMPWEAMVLAFILCTLLCIRISRGEKKPV